MRSAPPPPHPPPRRTRDLSRLRRSEAAPKRTKTSRWQARRAPSPVKPNNAPALPPELLLEIVERCDTAAFIPCAAACRLLRGHVLSPAFLRRRRLRDAARGGFAPSSVLLGLFYRHYQGEPAPRPPPFTPTSAAVRRPFAPAAVFAGYTPVESRGGLLVLRRSDLFAEHAGICVYDPVARRRAFLPPPEVHQQSYALLLTATDHGSDGGGGALFRRLIVVDLTRLRLHYTIRTQSFSPEEPNGGGGAWGPVVDVFTPDNLTPRDVARPSPVILDVGGGALLHWLCTDQRTVLTLGADTAEVGTVELPPYHRLHTSYCWPQQQLLASSADGELSLLVAERLVISVWVRRAATGQWARRAAVDVERVLLLAKVEPAPPARRCSTSTTMRLEWFGERSGSVVAQVAGVGLLALNLETEEVCIVRSCDAEAVSYRYCPYERDLLAVLAAMAPL